MNMLERAARAIRDDMGPVFGTPEYLARPGNVERLEARRQQAAETHARLALLAALDPEDEALVEVVMRAIQQGAERNGAAPYDAIAGNKHAMEMVRDEATEVISAIKRTAQGEQL